MNKRLKFRALAGTVVTAVAALGSSAHAAVPQEITDAIATMKEDGITVATAFVVAVIAVAAIKFLRSAK